MENMQRAHVVGVTTVLRVSEREFQMSMTLRDTELHGHQAVVGEKANMENMQQAHLACAGGVTS